MKHIQADVSVGVWDATKSPHRHGAEVPMGRERRDDGGRGQDGGHAVAAGSVDSSAAAESRCRETARMMMRAAVDAEDGVGAYERAHARAVNEQHAHLRAAHDEEQGGEQHSDAACLVMREATDPCVQEIQDSQPESDKQEQDVDRGLQLDKGLPNWLSQQSDGEDAAHVPSVMRSDVCAHCGKHESELPEGYRLFRCEWCMVTVTVMVTVIVTVTAAVNLSGLQA